MSTVERLRRANPVPDPERLLAELGDMDAFVDRSTKRSPATTMEDRVSHRTRQQGLGWLVAVAAAVVVLAVGTALALLDSPANVQPAGPSARDQIAYVERAYDALNAGDVDGWAALFAVDADARSQSDLLSVLAAANYRVEAVDPCASPERGIVVCTITETNDFFAAGGLSLTKTETFTFDGDGRISGRESAVRSMTQPGSYVYTQAFNEWMSKVHPDVYAEIRPEIITHLPQTPEDMQRALDYVEEFVAQSDRYPIGDE
jgi:hypothetical protein